jgi:cysteine synthase
MKDRMALAMIEGAEREGLISPGDTVVEYTGGSTGPALALVCRAKGYRALIVMADCFTEERSQLMKALGAEIDLIRSGEGPPKVTRQDIENMVPRAAELAAEPGHYATDQFKNPTRQSSPRAWRSRFSFSTAAFTRSITFPSRSLSFNGQRFGLRIS